MLRLVNKYLNSSGGWQYGYPIEVNDELARNSFALVYRLPNDEYCIFTSTEMEELSPGAKEFILWYEVGHIKSNHLYGLGNFLKRSDEILNFEQQVEADCYAASRIGIGNAITAMQEIYNRKKIPELKERLNRLRRMSDEEKP